MNTKFIIFDVGNVIIQADDEITFRILQEYGVLNDNARKFYDNTEYQELARGNITPESFYRTLIKTYLKCELSHMQIIHAHNAALYGLDTEVVKIISELPKDKVTFLTDTNEWQTQREKELIDLRVYSDLIFRSHEIGMLKIDPGCFSYVINKLGPRANEMIYIDDSIEKINMAKKIGIPALQFKDANQLRRYLESKNIL